jgi:6-pyruvoyltetrahydropterin/6-carboxytetrahydropterin synthase
MKNIIYYLDVHESFAAAHQVFGTDSPCNRLHGHNFKLHVRLSGKYLDSTGYLVDFYKVRLWVRGAIIEPLDHRFLNELAVFNGINTTCENIVTWIYNTLEMSVGSVFPELRLESVKLWENDIFSVTISNNISQADL